MHVKELSLNFAMCYKQKTKKGLSKKKWQIEDRSLKRNQSWQTTAAE